MNFPTRDSLTLMIQRPGVTSDWSKVLNEHVNLVTSDAGDKVWE